MSLLYISIANLQIANNTLIITLETYSIWKNIIAKYFLLNDYTLQKHL